MRREGVGSKPQRDDLRRELLAERCTPEQIATEMTRRWGYRPRAALRHAYGWTQEEVAARYNQTTGDPNAPMTAKRISDFEAWPVGGVKPTPQTLAVLAKIYDTNPAALVDLDDRRAFTPQERIALQARLPTTQSPLKTLQASDSFTAQTYPEVPDKILGIPKQEQGSKQSDTDLVLSAAYESRTHWEKAVTQIMPETTLEDITRNAERLVKEHMYTDSRVILPEVIETRDQIYRFLEFRQYPRQMTQLYYLASIMCSLLADLSVCLGVQAAVLEQERASWAYAEIIGHNSLRVQARIGQAKHYYSGKRPENALKLAQSALQWATEPLAMASLQNRIALYYAATARHNEARSALIAGREAFERSTGDSELFDQLGGVFHISLQRHLQISVKTYLELGDLDAAEDNALEAIHLYENAPPDQRADGSEASLHIDLGSVRLLKNDGEGAAEALQHVLHMPISRIDDFIFSMLKDFQVAMHHQSISTSTFGRQLTDEVESVIASGAARWHP